MALFGNTTDNTPAVRVEVGIDEKTVMILGIVIIVAIMTAYFMIRSIPAKT